MTDRDNDEKLIELMKTDEVPEPSPLFWQHFATRVNERIDAAPAERQWFLVPRFAFVALTVLAIVLVSFNVLRPQRADPPAPVPVVADGPAAPVPADDLDADDDWAVVRAAAEDLDLEDAQAQGLVPAPGTAERMALDLTDAERAELLRLLQAEMKIGA